jgi:putative ABC transport system substrate-binding protein
MRFARLTALTTLAVALLAASLAAEAQPTTRPYRVGLLAGGLPPSHRAPLTEALRELGYVEGQNLLIESRYAEGRPERLPNLAAELVLLKVDVIVTVTTPATAAAKGATATIPIVMTDVGDPLATGLVASLPRSGGNVTGLSIAGAEIAKRALEVLKEAVPSIGRVAVVRGPTNPAQVFGYREMEILGKALGVVLRPVDGIFGADLDRIFTDVRGHDPDALFVMPLHAKFSDWRRIADFAVKSRLPASGGDARSAEAGLLLACFPQEGNRFPRVGVFVDKILKGASPADLPIEQSTKSKLVINLKTAKALGLTIPPAVLARADEVIQ